MTSETTCANCGHGPHIPNGAREVLGYDDLCMAGGCDCTRFVERTMWNCMKCYPRLCHCPAPTTQTAEVQP